MEYNHQQIWGQRFLSKGGNKTKPYLFLYLQLVSELRNYRRYFGSRKKEEFKPFNSHKHHQLVAEPILTWKLIPGGTFF